jgi:Transposase DDE domain
MDAETLVAVQARMPLAEAGLAIWRYVFDERRLAGVWERHRGRCYENVITFATMTHLVADALLQHDGSGRRSFEKNMESGQLEASPQAAFGKLGRLPIDVSMTLLREGTAALREIFPRYALRELPSSLSGYEAVVIDGKTIKNVAKRLKPLRGVGGGLLGGKAVVALEWSTGLALAMHAHGDGDASEKRFVKDVVAQTDQTISKPRVFVADRAYCDLVQTAHFTARTGDQFLVRHHSGTKFSRDSSRPEQKSTDSDGRRVVESWGWLGSQNNQGRRYVRKICLRRPGEEDLVLITSLLDEDAVPAADLLWLYQERWGIERMFQKVTEVFGLKQLIGGTPKACIFQFAFCMILYNIVQLMTGYVAQAQKREPETISKEKLFDDVHQQLVAWNVVFTPEQTTAQFETTLTATILRQRLRRLLAHAWSDTWLKAPAQKNRPPRQREAKRGHASVYRILQQHAKIQPKTTRQRC